MLTYHDAQQVFPQNHRPASAATTTVRERWFTLVLPYIEQQNMYNQYDPTTNWDSGTNLPVTSLPIKVAVCPSTPNAGRLDNNPAFSKPEGWGPNNPLDVGVTDYAGVYGVHPSFIAANPGIPIGNPYGVMTNNVSTNPGEAAPVTIVQVSDGSSNTILLAESAGRPNLYQGGIQQGSNYTAHVVNGGGWSRPASEIWLIGFSDTVGLSPGGPNTINIANGVDAAGVYPLTVPAGAPLGTDGSGQIYGFHGSGANVVFVDGSVHSLDRSISAAVIAALVTRANGDIVPGNAF